MSEENVELIRRLIEHVNETGELPSECYDPQVVYTTHPDDPVQTTYRGIEGVRRAWANIGESWDRIHIAVLGVTETEEAVVAHLRLQLRGHGSGIELEVEQSLVYWMRDGKIVKVEQHLSRADALQAVGLGE